MNDVDAIVPCGDCRACCRNWQAIVLMPEDIGRYPYDTVQPLQCSDLPPMLKHTEDGSCIYLGVDGCTIWEHRPTLCRAFDCRGAFLLWERQPAAEKAGDAMHCADVLAAGAARLHTLPSDHPTRFAQ